MKQFSNFLSIIFHPIGMVTYAAAIYFFLIPSEFVYQSWLILGLIVTGTVLIPAMVLLFLWKLGSIKSVRIEDQKERNWPLLLGALIYFCSYYMMQRNGIPDFIPLFLLGAILGILVALLINLKWKISLHMIGIGGICGGLCIALFLQQGNPAILAIAFLVAGLLGMARLYLQAHSPAQVFAGFLIGFAIQSGLMLFVIR